MAKEAADGSDEAEAQAFVQIFEANFAESVMKLPPGAGEKRESSWQSLQMRRKRFNARGCL